MTRPSEHISLSKTALMVIDVQMAFVHRDEAGVPRTTPMAENNIGRLLDWFRSSGGKTIHIHHHSHQKDSPFTAGLPGAVVQPFAEPAPGEAVYVKYVNSSFIGTGLEDDLRRDGIEHLILCGTTANQCVETTGPDGRKPRLQHAVCRRWRLGLWLRWTGRPRAQRRGNCIIYYQ